MTVTGSTPSRRTWPAGRRTGLVVLGAVLVATTGSACGAGNADDPTVDVAAVADADQLYDCLGVSTTEAELAAAPSVAELTDHLGAEAFAEAVGDSGDLEEWTALDVTDDTLGAIRSLDPPDVIGGDVRVHERLIVSLAEGRTGWAVSSAGSCTLQAELDGLGPASVLLNPASLPTAEDTSLSLLVIEMACASGQPATDRVTVTVEESTAEVRLIPGVRPSDGSHTCQSNPPTPVTVQLSQPLGDRRIVNAARLPEIEIGTPDSPVVPVSS